MTAVLPPPSRGVSRLRFEGDAPAEGFREVPEETPIALVHDAVTTAVMMATPADLEDLAWGFTLTEGLVSGKAQIRSVEIVPVALGVEARVWLDHAAGTALTTRRRALTGVTGCGLCGIESLEAATRPSARVGKQVRVSPAQLQEALDALEKAQTLGAATRAVHAAAWWAPGEGLVAIREDVGRHNALDKLIGALARADRPADGVLVLTSRVSVEMVQKATAFGAEILVAVSVPTALAVRTAQAAGQTLIAVARQDAFEVFTHPDRLFDGTDNWFLTR